MVKLFNKLSQLRLSTCIFYVLWLLAIVFFFTYYGKYNYDHIAKEELTRKLYHKINPKVKFKDQIPDCDYEQLLKSTKSVQAWEVLGQDDIFSARGVVNGTFVPDCMPLFSVAILVTYRNRQKQLDTFLPYMHNFLRKQNIHYRIYLIEQQDEKPWNKGLLYNIGARQAIADKFPCLILHDVDLLPLDDGNLYACTQHPRHMSASIDKFRYVLPYDWLVGGVLAIRADQYTMVNGFSNKFQGWGGEDDDFSRRIFDHKLEILRFPRQQSRYFMIRHRQEPKNEQRERIMAENRAAPGTEGFNTLHYEELEVKPGRLVMHLLVKL